MGDDERLDGSEGVVASGNRRSTLSIEKTECTGSIRDVDDDNSPTHRKSTPSRETTEYIGLIRALMSKRMLQVTKLLVIKREN